MKTAKSLAYSKEKGHMKKTYVLFFEVHDIIKPLAEVAERQTRCLQAAVRAIL